MPTTHDAGPPPPGEEVPAQDPIEEIAHAAPDDLVVGEVLEGELLDETQATAGGDAGSELLQAMAERDEYLAHLQRTQAEFDNYRKRMLRDQTLHLERATANLIEQ